MAEKGDQEAIRRLALHYADIKDFRGAVRWALKSNNELVLIVVQIAIAREQDSIKKVKESLPDREANVNEANNLIESTLHYAGKYGKPNLVGVEKKSRHLSNNGARVVLGEGGNHHTSCYSSGSTERVERFL